ncbi:MAG: hypothetical protein AAGE61_10345 [Pseudomonadota bacterium]
MTAPQGLIQVEAFVIFFKIWQYTLVASCLIFCLIYFETVLEAYGIPTSYPMFAIMSVVAFFAHASALKRHIPIKSSVGYVIGFICLCFAINWITHQVISHGGSMWSLITTGELGTEKPGLVTLIVSAFVGLGVYALIGMAMPSYVAGIINDIPSVIMRSLRQFLYILLKLIIQGIFLYFSLFIITALILVGMLASLSPGDSVFSVDPEGWMEDPFRMGVFIGLSMTYISVLFPVIFSRALLRDAVKHPLFLEQRFE